MKNQKNKKTRERRKKEVVTWCPKEEEPKRGEVLERIGSVSYTGKHIRKSINFGKNLVDITGHWDFQKPIASLSVSNEWSKKNSQSKIFPYFVFAHSKISDDDTLGRLVTRRKLRHLDPRPDTNKQGTFSTNSPICRTRSTNHHDAFVNASDVVRKERKCPNLVKVSDERDHLYFDRHIVDVTRDPVCFC